MFPYDIIPCPEVKENSPERENQQILRRQAGQYWRIIAGSLEGSGNFSSVVYQLVSTLRDTTNSKPDRTGEGGMDMKRASQIVILGLCLVWIATVGWAQNFSMAGCGLGSLAFQGKKDKASQIFAATTNGTSGNQTFGITSGTSNCTTDGVVMESRARQAFAEANLESLSQEMAQGQGEHVTAFAHLMGCSENSVQDFGRVVQQNYTRIFPHDQATPLDVIDAVKESIASDPVLSRACQG